MKYILLVGVCAVSVLSSCNLKPITYEVKMSSNTLVIDNTVATKNKDYEGTIALIDPDEDYRLPTLITITISNRALEDKDYTYDYNSGHLRINANVVTDVITISAEKVGLESYSATFIGDEHIKFYFYRNRDYSINPIEGTLAKSRDKDTGLLLKDGHGEINFKVEIDENYDIDTLWVRGLYDECQDSKKIGIEDIYRITEIRGDLDVIVVTKKIYCKNFAASDDLENNSFTFSWVTRKPENIDYINIDVASASRSEHFVVYENNFIFKNADENKVYNFAFYPHLKNGGGNGGIVTCSRSLVKGPKTIAIPRIEIATKNNVWPSFKSLSGPFTMTPGHTEYVKNSIKMYNDNNELIFETAEDFSGSKIKVRGNSTAEYPKKPYKLKLSKPYDMLREYRTPSEINYEHKEWVLLAPNLNKNTWKVDSEILRTPIGFTIANSLDFEFKPKFLFINLYINNDYQGLYILCEPTTKGNGKGDKQSRYKIDDDGYIIEKDLFWESEDLYFDTINNTEQFTFKYPDTDNINCESAEYTYIKDYVTEFEAKLYKNDENYLKYIDIDSFAKWLIEHDILQNNDCYGSNKFLYKKNSNESSKLVMGTPWDFDETLTDPEKLATIRYDDSFYIKKFVESDSFNSKLKNLYLSSKANVNSDINSYLNSIDNEIFDAVLTIEAARWGFEPIDLAVQKNNIQSFFTSHFNFLDYFYGTL